MKRSLSLKQWSLFLALLALASILTLHLYGKAHQDTRFRTFAQNFFLEEVQANPIHLHYTIDDPAAYGIDEGFPFAAHLSGRRPAAEEIYVISRAREELSHIDPNALQENNRRLYERLESYLTTAANVAAYPYFSEPLSPVFRHAFGISHSFFAEYRLDDIADVENYLRTLEQVPAYFDGLILYEQEKAAAGLFMSDTTADRMIAQCTALLDVDSLEDGSHFLETTFADRLRRLVDLGSLTSESASSYEAEHKRILTTLVAPAYDHLADALTLLKGQGGELCGLAGRENGRDYYLALLRLRTGSYRDISEIKRLLAEDLKLNYETLVSILRRNPGLQSMILQTPDLLPKMTPEEVLSDLRKEIGTSYPSIPKGRDNAPIHSTIKYVDDSLAAYSAPAFYMTPPIDNICENLICLNPKDTSDDLSLYTTLAHEGISGHLYQTVYSKRFQEQEGSLPLSGILYYGGYVEGWAMYVELASYDRATALAVHEHPEAALYYQVCRLDRQFRLGLYSLLDVAIHYDGLSLEEVGALCRGLGINDGDALTSLYTYIAEEPCNYLKYYLGYLEIIELKRQAAVLWSDTESLRATYDNTDFLYRFHSFFLQNGPADYRTLARRLAVN